MTALDKITSNLFGDVEVDFFQNERGDIIMTAEQIGSALGYANARKAINTIYDRNKVRLEKFSDYLKTRSTDGKMYETRIFNEHGIYALIFLSNKPNAIEFQEWVYQKISEIRQNNFSLVVSGEHQPELIQKVKELENKIDSMITISSYEARVVQKAINYRVCELVKDKEQRSLGFQEIHREIRDRFGVPSYRDIAKGDLNDAVGYIRAWIPKKVTA